MAINMATKESTTTRSAQQEFWEMARDRSFSPFGGANPRGWVATLNEEGVGPYELVSVPTFDEALQTAAAAIRATKRPVGLVMWRGRHAWVMSGFTSTADPADSRRLRRHGRTSPRSALSQWQQRLGTVAEAEHVDGAVGPGRPVRHSRPRPRQPRRAAGLPPGSARLHLISAGWARRDVGCLVHPMFQVTA